MGIDYDSNIILGCRLDFEIIKNLIDISNEGPYEGDIACTVDDFLDDENLTCKVSSPWFDCPKEDCSYDLHWRDTCFLLRDLKELNEDEMLIIFNKALKKMGMESIKFLSVYSMPNVW